MSSAGKEHDVEDGDHHQGVKIALLQEGRGQEFSELVEDLLAEWLKARR